MPPKKQTLAAKESKKKKVDTDAIEKATTRITIVEPNGKTLDIAVFKDRSFLIRGQTDPDQTTTFTAHPSRPSWVNTRTPKPNPEPNEPDESNLDSQVHTDQNLNSAREFAKSVKDEPEATLIKHWPQLDVSALATDPYFGEKIDAAAGEIQNATASITEPNRRPAVSLAKRHPINNDADINLHTQAAKNRFIGNHPSGPGTSSPFPTQPQNTDFAAYASYLDSIPGPAKLLSTPPASYPQSPSKQWQIKLNPYEAHYLKTGHPPPIPKAEQDRKIWWEFTDRYPETAGTMYVNAKPLKATEPTKFRIPTETQDNPIQHKEPTVDHSRPGLFPSQDSEQPLAHAAKILQAITTDTTTGKGIELAMVILENTDAHSTTHQITVLQNLAEQRVTVLSAHNDDNPSATPDQKALAAWQSIIDAIAQPEATTPAEIQPATATA